MLNKMSSPTHVGTRSKKLNDLTKLSYATPKAENIQIEKR
jgi:hypothetical protein